MVFSSAFIIFIIVCCGSNFLSYLLLFLDGHISYSIICVIVIVNFVKYLFVFRLVKVNRYLWWIGFVLFLRFLRSFNNNDNINSNNNNNKNSNNNNNNNNSSNYYNIQIGKRQLHFIWLNHGLFDLNKLSKGTAFMFPFIPFSSVKLIASKNF